mgnify:CR=1 FL=1
MNILVTGSDGQLGRALRRASVASSDRYFFTDVAGDDTLRLDITDADAVEGQLILRRWQSGDRFVPFGMKGFKSVRNYLRDKKVSRFEKDRQLVVCDGNRIVWLVNERVDNRFRVTSDTHRILRLEVKWR